MINSNSKLIHRDLSHLMDSGRTLVSVKTYEEERLERLLTNIAKAYQRDFMTWDVNAGLISAQGFIENSLSPSDALNHLLKHPGNVVVLLKDFHHSFNPKVLRGLRDLYRHWRGKSGMAVLSSASKQVPEDLEREMAYLVLDMPSPQELNDLVESWREEHDRDWSIPARVMTATLKGLTLAEAAHGLARLENPDIRESDVLGILQEEKRLLIAKTGTLDYIPSVPTLDQLGGLENLKDWLVKRRSLLVSGKESDREIVPKGVLLMGVSGCGKSLCVKAISAAWQLPLYRIEMVRIFSGAHGSPESAFAEACKLMEQMAPAVLWIDEIEMGLSGEGSSMSNASLARIFAFFLTWMQEKPPGLFVAATANRIDLLPAEMIRKGRFDQVFFVDLPTKQEREQIFTIHLRKRGYDPESFTPDVFADATSGWSGAEIEQCVIAAITGARMENRELGLKDLYGSRKQIVPISTTMEEQVRHIRNWAYERAVRASVEQ